MSFWTYLWIAVRTGILMLMVYFALAGAIDICLPEDDLPWRVILGFVAMGLAIYIGLSWGIRKHEAKRV